MKYPPLKDTFVLGFVGKARAGKSEACSVLEHMLSSVGDFNLTNPVPRIRTYAFSDMISCYARVVGKMTTREPKVLQDFGMELRDKDPDVWARSLYWTINEHSPDVALVNGIRFPAEVEMLRDLNAILIRITRCDSKTGEEFISKDRDPNHRAESSIDQIETDWTVLNTDLSDFRITVREVYWKLRRLRQEGEL